MQAAQDFGRLVANSETTTSHGSILIERTACSTWRGAVENIRLSITRLHYAQLANRGQRSSAVRPKKLKTKPKWQDLKGACRNLKTMPDMASSSRPDRRSVLIAHELSSLNIDIADLCELRLLTRAAFKKLVLVSPSFCLGNHQLIDVFQVRVLW